MIFLQNSFKCIMMSVYVQHETILLILILLYLGIQEQPPFKASYYEKSSIQ